MMQGDSKTGQNEMDAMFVMIYNGTKQVLAESKKLLTGTQWLTIAPRKRIRIAFASQLGVT
jgi:hypothetical protein